MRIPSTLKAFVFLACAPTLLAQVQIEATEMERTVDGLDAQVELIIDPWGVTHIYAQSERDLFFAQGYNAARDRLFQLEMWRRRATGTMAEIQGDGALSADIGSRLLRYRGDLIEEMNHYHPRGNEIITSFVAGINAYIDWATEDDQRLAPEFSVLNFRPGKWTPADVVSRHNGLFRNASSEISLADLVSRWGEERVQDALYFDPVNPSLELDSKIDPQQLSSEILASYRASRRPPKFDSIEIGMSAEPENLPGAWAEATSGSNNWVVRDEHLFNARTIMANDPHRSHQIPSLRYWVHLNAPGWNVVGSGEPALPGVAIGHNEIGAWGLTIFSIDQEDLYVYDLDPDDPTQYAYKGSWEKMTTVTEEFSIAGGRSENIDLMFTRHGPVLHRDLAANKAYGLRAAWLEKGSAPYLASLRMDQAASWEEFQEACRYFLTPSENMVWADTLGNIGWQATGISPIRPNWNGLLPVPGDGSYEWSGFLDPDELPSEFNPDRGWIATANENNLPDDYPHEVGFQWAEQYRMARITEVMESGRSLSMTDMMSLQLDEVSIPARHLATLLKGLTVSNPEARQVLDAIIHWDNRLSEDSRSAAAYITMENEVRQKLKSLLLPAAEFSLATTTMIDLLLSPDHRFGSNPVEGRDRLLREALGEAHASLEARFESADDWIYGSKSMKHISYEHALTGVLSDSLLNRFNPKPLPRGGTGHTVNATSNSLRQTSGASFRIITDTGDWDRTLGSNTPGQSGDPRSKHYADLYPEWAAGRYFPVFYSREKIESVREQTIRLIPG